MPKPEKLYTTDPLMITRTTDKAFAVQSDGEKELIWIPFSQLIEPDEDTVRASIGEEIEFTIPDWLAREKGFY